ncbi:ATP-binding protein [Legionella fallonii]|uniref:histidine kinase n=1 Tax=Legionella fallonii LLAP-10 TaxID=1212491 RepID=A0A098G7P3_9GAMM|nr:ATP-binding protein [Legionella fallonii]CEG57984.1 putative Histidine kinase [Legionella fallonii LLAP-10]
MEISAADLDKPYILEAELPVILLVGAEPGLSHHIISSLANVFKVTSVMTTQETVDGVMQHQPQLILINHLLPNLDGVAIAQSLKNNGDIGYIPSILMLTKEEQQQIKDKSVNELDDYLLKPFSSEELHTRIQISLRLHQMNQKLNNEVSKRIDLAKENQDLYAQLNTAIKKAGMTDVVTNVLHDIGTILNSINTSISIISEKISKSRVADLAKLTQLLYDHQADIQNYISNDPHGKHVLNYLQLLSNNWVRDNESLICETSSLHNNIGHIKNIIALQQTSSRSIETCEEVSISELIEDSLSLNKAAYERYKIKVARDFQLQKKVVIDKIKLFQVIINLIKNSIDSLKEKKEKNKKLIVTTQTKDEANFIIKVIDNGVGIASEHLNKVFTYGFTTKKTGHGFGLHACINAVKEMHGTLSVASDGLSKGATFTLILPNKPYR